jgi:hypothetical protein
MWKKYGRAGQAKDGNIMCRMRIARQIRLIPTDLILMLFHDKTFHVKSPQYFFIPILSLFFTLNWYRKYSILIHVYIALHSLYFSCIPAVEDRDFYTQKKII